MTVFARLDLAFTQCRLTQAKNRQRNTAAGFPSAVRQREHHAGELQYSQTPPCLITKDRVLETQACPLARLR
jgi:hypothetical protein